MSVSVSFERSIRPDREPRLALRHEHPMGYNDTIFCQRAEDELQVVISKTFRTSANGICQMPASNVPYMPWKKWQRPSGVRGQM